MSTFSSNLAKTLSAPGPFSRNRIVLLHSELQISVPFQKLLSFETIDFPGDKLATSCMASRALFPGIPGIRKICFSVIVLLFTMSGRHEFDFDSRLRKFFLGLFSTGLMHRFQNTHIRSRLRKRKQFSKFTSNRIIIIPSTACVDHYSLHLYDTFKAIYANAALFKCTSRL